MVEMCIIEVDEMMSCFFSDLVIEHFRYPRNSGQMADAEGEGTFGEPGCGRSWSPSSRGRVGSQ